MPPVPLLPAHEIVGEAVADRGGLADAADAEQEEAAAGRPCRHLP